MDCNSLIKMTDHYLIEPGPIKFNNPNTQVIELEPVAASLAEIIKYRRENNWEWVETEFNQLVYDLMNALNILHIHDITHNDIRPENVFYSA